MDERQAFALEHPATNPDDVLNPKFQGMRRHSRGFLLLSILAVDR